jgi:phosphoadenosine phosphosulfate reductase
MHMTESSTRLCRQLGQISSLEDRLRHVREAVSGRIAFSTSLGLEDQAVLHAIATTGLDISVFTLDTGRHFPETIDTLAASVRRYGVAIDVLVPAAADAEETVARDGILGFRTSIDARKACCNARKVLPLRRGLRGSAAWITGLRRGQSAGRADVAFAEPDAEHSLLKINPLADWSLERLQHYIAEHEIPVNPLHTRGFPSIGCQPCTRAIRPGEDIRAGRWWWERQDGRECGLHSHSNRTAPAS